jgi:hypothetical protein
MAENQLTKGVVRAKEVRTTTLKIGSNTLTGTELAAVDGVVAGTSSANKAAVLGANKNLDTLVIADGGLKLGAGAGTAVTATAAELNLIDGSLAGTSVASKALALGANKETDVLALPVSGLKIGAGAGTAVDRTAAELNGLVQGVAAGYKVARGETAVTGTADIATGLATVLQATATLETDPALGTAMWASVADSGTPGNIILKTWKPTGAADVTPIAGTGTPSVRWIAIGT